MEALFFLIGVTEVMLLIVFVARELGWLFTEVIRLPLNFKPFNCRPCLTFWFTVAICIAYSFIIAPVFIERGIISDAITGYYSLTGIGFLLGYINYLSIKLKFKIYD
jgi:hypothetical protein